MCCIAKIISLFCFLVSDFCNVVLSSLLSFLSLCLLINQIRSLKVSSYKWVTKDFKYDFANSFYKGSPKQDLWAKGCGSGGCRRARSKLFSNTQEMSNNITVVIWFTNILKSSYPRSIICQNWRKDVRNSNLQKQMTWTKIYKVVIKCLGWEFAKHLYGTLARNMSQEYGKSFFRTFFPIF